MSYMSEEVFRREACVILGTDLMERDNESSLTTYHRHFGTSPRTCSILWNLMVDKESLERESRPKHLLWTLMWMYLYQSYTVLCLYIGCTHKTFQKHRNMIVKALNEIQIVSHGI